MYLKAPYYVLARYHGMLTKYKDNDEREKGVSGATYSLER